MLKTAIAIGILLYIVDRLLPPLDERPIKFKYYEAKHPERIK